MEKILVSEKWYLKIKAKEEKLSVRNSFISSYLNYFDITNVLQELKIFQKVKGRWKPGDDDSVSVYLERQIDSNNTDEYILSLSMHERLGQELFTDSGFVSWSDMACDYLNSEPGIINDLLCKQVETEIKLNILKQYDKKKHREFLHLE